MRAPDSPSPFHAAVAAVLRLAARMRAAAESRRVVRGLASLDDHMLRDIGLTRFDVQAALIEPAMTDGTLVLAERARAQRQGQRALGREARGWSGLASGERRAA